MADDIKKVDDMELIRAHTYVLLDEPDNGVLATKKAGIAYDTIRDYSAKLLSPISTQKLRDLYEEAAAAGRGQEFEEALYGMLYMYGLGKVGYTRLAKVLNSVDNAADFLTNVDETLIKAQQKSDIKVAYPYPVPMRMPEAKIVGKKPEEEAPVAAQQDTMPKAELISTRMPESASTRRAAKVMRAPEEELPPEPVAVTKPGRPGTVWEPRIHDQVKNKSIDLQIVDTDGSVRNMTNAGGAQKIVMGKGRDYTLTYEKDELLIRDDKGNQVAEYQVKKNFFGTPTALVEKVAPPAEFPLTIRGAKADGNELALQMKAEDLARQKARQRQAS